MMRGLAIAALAIAPMVADAQVGNLPAQSPYRDVSPGMRLGVYAGWYKAATDVIGVTPESGPLLGLRWDAHIGGPAELSVRAAVVSSQRDVIDPVKPEGQRFVRTQDLRLGFGDVGLSFNLTGNKSWKRVVPLAFAAIGVVSDFGGTDVGGFKHGTGFAFSYGAGLRIVRWSSMEMRVDLGSHFYQLEYPSSYYVPASDGTSVLTDDTPRSNWRNNWALTFGLSWITPY